MTRNDLETFSMSRRSFGGLVAFGAATAATPRASVAAPQEDDSALTLRVLCYNIHYGQGNDGQYDIPRIAEVIRQTEPDLVALQEIDVHVERSARRHELRMLAEATGLAGWFGPTQHYEGGLFGNGILSRWPVHEVHIQPLPYTEATPELRTYPRAAIAAVVQAAGGKRLRFISTHFQHARFEEDRLAEAIAINRHFATARRADDAMGEAAAALPTILAGDFNAVVGSPPIEELQKRWTPVVENDPVPTAPATDPRSRIDFIMHRTADPIRVIEHRVIDERLASDHLPVFAVLRLV